MTDTIARKVIIKNLSTVVRDAEITGALPSFQKLVSQDFFSKWGIDAALSFVGKDDPTPPDGYLLVVLDDADQAGALGYHDLAQGGQPLGKVFAKTTKQYNGEWTVTFTHELLEMLADPNINLTAFDENAQRAYMYEVCDAVEADNLGYQIDGVLVSDFVTPGWFEPTNVVPGEQFAFKSPVRAPFTLMPGGYIGYMDLRGGGWHQLTAQEIADARKLDIATGGRGHIDGRARVGSRRERRRTPKSQWLRSTRV